ncbi:hypothetical protein V8G54_021059 [Vigna mungo]|uniref:Uncharacterized protein n=1 Tax=Vigna mungo TaxID=3915 RepID=A0AAQ3RWI4_VIGMU
MINVPFRNLCVSIRGNDVSEEKLVDKLKVRPRGIEARLLFLRIGGFLAGVLVRRRREAPEDIDGHHFDHLLLASLCYLPRTRLYEIHELHQRLPLDFLFANALQRVREVQHVTAYLKLPNEQGLPLRHRHVAEQRQRLYGPRRRRHHHLRSSGRHRRTEGGRIARVRLGGLLLPSLHDSLKHF